MTRTQEQFEQHRLADQGGEANAGFEREGVDLASVQFAQALVDARCFDQQLVGPNRGGELEQAGVLSEAGHERFDARHKIAGFGHGSPLG